jgi:hypothetical protein
MFLDAEDMIAEATALAEQKVDTYRADADRLKDQIAELDREIGRYLPLLADPDIEPLAKKAISGQVAQRQAKQDALRGSLDSLGEQMAQNTSELAEAIRDAFREAKDMFGQAATPSEFNRLVDEAFGPLLITAEGKVVQKTDRTGVETTAPSASEGRWVPDIAGACFEPCADDVVRAGYWNRPALAA